MRKYMIVISIVMLLWVTPAKAHLTGAFADFLSIVHDESTINKLKEEMEKTEEQIAQLEPKVTEMESVFKEHQDVAVEQLQSYSETGLDTWMSLLMQEQELVDIMGDQWLVEKNIQLFLNDLDGLYAKYMSLKSAKESLEGHQVLLEMIEENIQSRNQFLMDNADIPLDQQANYLDIDWVSEVEDDLIAILEADRTLVKEKVSEWILASSVESDYVLAESWLNEQSDVQYFFRSDHVYIVYKKRDLHVILLGQVLQQSEEYAELKLEAGFFNGFLLPETLLEELPGLQIQFELLRQLYEGSPSVYLEQANGKLLISPKGVWKE